MAQTTASIKKVYVVSHTHWDREWYQDFQGYRARLVYLIDELLDVMENNPDYRYFMMDGQTIVVDDYLRIRPENRPRLMKLIREGRITVGPWYVMPDEFLVSGESLIRNLSIGFRRARSWGVEPMKSGYVTDIFGHNSQLPQLLRGFGIDNAVLFRGFRGDGDASEMEWEGADGSRVLGLKLDEDRSYGDFYFFLRWPFAERDFAYDPDELVERAQAMLRYKSERATTDLMLGLDGVDHIEVEPRLPWMLSTLNGTDRLDGVEFVHTHLEHYLQELRERISGLQVYRGEQRSPGFKGVNNWLMNNVLSSRIHLKQRNQDCETALERWAEPWGVFAALEGRAYPKAFLAQAWEYLIQNHPHDSICGCSIDQVHRDMIYRFDQSRLIAEQMIAEELKFVSNHLDTSTLDGEYAVTLFNASPAEVDGVVETEIALPSAVPGFAAGLMGSLFRLLDGDNAEVPYQLLELKPNSLRKLRPYRDIPHAEQVHRYRIAFHARIPSFGYATYSVKPLQHEGPGPGEYAAPRMMTPVRYPGSMQAGADEWDNGRIRLKVHPNGSITLLDHETGRSYGPLLLFEDEADIGEGWNHISPVTNEVFRTVGVNADISVPYDGPLAARIQIRTVWRLPKSIDAGETRRHPELVDVPIVTRIDLRKNDPVVVCRTAIDNRARDHRLKLLLATGLQAESFATSTPFDLVRRDIVRPDYSGYMEKGRDEVPHNGIVTLADEREGLAVYTKGMYEAAVRDDAARTVALTLFRSTGKEVLSDGGDGGQLLGELVFDYAIRPYRVEDGDAGRLFREHHAFVAGIRNVDRKKNAAVFETAQRREEANLPLAQSFLKTDNPSFAVSAVKAAEDLADVFIVRIFNVSEREQEGELVFAKPLAEAVTTNLDEQPLGELPHADNRVRLTAKAKGIVTIAVRFRS